VTTLAIVFGSGSHTLSIDLFSAGNDFGAESLANDIFFDSFDPDSRLRSRRERPRSACSGR
jgi:hypothetical protein